jgi:hypothetical protein
MATETRQLTPEAEAAMRDMESYDGAYWARGHHDKAAFAEAVGWYDGEDYPDPATVRHEYWRVKRVGETDIFLGADPDWQYMYTPTKKGRGAFPVTVWDRRSGRSQP